MARFHLRGQIQTCRARDLLIFDPATGELLAQEQYWLNRSDFIDAEPPVQFNVIAYAEVAYVDEWPELGAEPAVPVGQALR